MPTRKIEDAKPPCMDHKLPCMDPDHNPPNNMYYSPGTYEHECPSCHEKVVFTVPYIN